MKVRVLANLLVAVVLGLGACSSGAPGTASPDAALANDVALADVAAGDGAVLDADVTAVIADTVIADTVGADTATADTGTAEDASATDVGVADVETADVQAQSGLALTVQAPTTGPMAGTLHVFALPLASLGKSGGPGEDGAVPLVSVATGQWPWLGQVSVSKGQWVVGAIVTQGAAFNPMDAVAMAMGCADGAAILVQSDGAVVTPPALTLTLSTQPKPISQLCGTGATAGPTQLLTETFQVAPPSTQAGGAHLLEAWSVQDKLWVAGHADSWVSFDLSAGKTPSGTAGWKLQGKGLCSRLHKVGARLFGAGRRDVLAVATLEASTGKALDFALIQMAPGALAEGMAEVNGAVMVASHQLGLLLHDANPPYKSKPLQVIAATGQTVPVDAWDVAALGADRVVVADGVHGLKIAKITAVSPLTLQFDGHVPLPGLATHVRMAGQQALVTSPSGRLAVVDLSQPTQPVVQVKLQVPSPMFGSTAMKGLAFVAAGPQLWAVDLPPVGALASAPKVRTALNNWNYGLDVTPLGDQLVSAEFAILRTLAIQPSAPAQPLLIAPKTTYTRVGAVGSNLLIELTLWAVGGDVAVQAVNWIEDGANSNEGTPALDASTGKPLGALQIAAGSHKTVQLAVPKTKKGLTDHLVHLQREDGMDTVAQVRETALLQPGDALPPLAYADAQGKLLNINQYLAGKPGLVVVAAHNCPVALLSLAGLTAEVAGAVQAGQLGAVVIEPWDKPIDVPEVAAVNSPFPVLYSPLTTSDSHAYSALQMETLAQPTNSAGGMPLIYVVDAQGKIVYCRSGYEPGALRLTLQALGINLAP